MAPLSCCPSKISSWFLLSRRTLTPLLPLLQERAPWKSPHVQPQLCQADGAHLPSIFCCLQWSWEEPLQTVRKYFIQLTCTGNLHGDPASLPFLCSCACLFWIGAKSLFSLLSTFRVSPIAHLWFLGPSQDLFSCFCFSPPWPAVMQSHLDAFLQTWHSGIPMHSHAIAA